MNPETAPQLQILTSLDSRDALLDAEIFETEPPKTTDSIQHHKLDVLLSKQINLLVKLNILACGICVIYVLISIILTNTIFLQHKAVKWKDNPPRIIRATAKNHVFFIFELFTNSVASLGLFLLAIIYPYRVLLNNRFCVTQTQVWVTVMVFTQGFTMNPIVQVLLLHDELFGIKSEFMNSSSYHELIKGMRTVRSVGSTVSIIFFLMASCVTYGQLHRMKTKNEFILFYVPKVLPLLAYQIVREFARFQGNIVLSVIPFSSFVGMVVNSLTLGIWFTKQLLYVSILTAFEFGFLVYLFWQVKATGWTLKNCNYLKYRSKQLGFRFFLWVNLGYYLLFFFLDLLVSVAVPRYNNLKPLLGKPQFQAHVYTNAQYGGYSYEYLNLLYQFTSAYVFLPPDSHGLLGWLRPTLRKVGKSGNLVDQEPLSLSTVERTAILMAAGDDDEATSLSKKNKFQSASLDTRPHSYNLCLPTHIGLFNFAWLAYDFGRNGVLGTESFKWLADRDPRIQEHIMDSETDTNLIIVSASDRIIVSFKGTTSMNNVKTDANLVRVHLSNGLPTRPGCDHEMTKDIEWNRARVHKGFMDAYIAVAERIVNCVAKILKSGPRPVLLTGHSLGAALATLCSLDLRASLGLTETNVLVSTFGSPRVGNYNFCELYDRYVPIHWRFTVDSDPIPFIPRIGYRHVGKRVLLMTSGNMFLDPNSLESVIWGANVPSMLYHRKPCYLHCITRFCNKFTKFAPKIWGNVLSDELEIESDLKKLRIEATEAETEIDEDFLV